MSRLLSERPEGWGMARAIERVSHLSQKYPKTVGRLIMGQTIKPWSIVDAQPGEFMNFEDAGNGRLPAQYSHGVVLGTAPHNLDVWGIYDNKTPHRAAAAFKVGETVLATPVGLRPEPPRPYEPNAMALTVAFRLGVGPLEASIGTLDTELETFTPASGIEVVSHPLPLDQIYTQFPDVQRV